VAEYFDNASLIDLILVLVLLEGVVLAAWRRRSGRGPRPMDMLFNLAAGACLLLALRAALVNAGWIWIAASLAGALVAHAIDLYRRWPAGEEPRRGGGSTGSRVSKSALMR